MSNDTFFIEQDIERLGRKANTIKNSLYNEQLINTDSALELRGGVNILWTDSILKANIPPQVGKTLVYGTVEIPSSVNEMRFTVTGITDWIKIGGDDAGYIGVGITSGIGKVVDFYYDKNFTILDNKVTLQGLVGAVLGDEVKIKATGRSFIFEIKRVGESVFSSWFELFKSSIPSAISWYRSDQLGFTIFSAGSNTVSLQTLFSNLYYKRERLINVETKIDNIYTTSVKKFSSHKMNIIGDSLTFGVGGTVPYPTTVQSNLEIGTMRNYGISGSTLSYHSAGFTMATRYSDMEADADIVMVLGGTNDYWNALALGVIGDATTATFYGALEVLATGLISKYPNAFIFFATPPKSYRANLSYPNIQNTNSNTPEDFNKAIKDVCGKHTIPVLDLKHTLGIDPENTTHYTNLTSDGVHYNNAGYKIIGNTVSNFVKSNCNKF